MFCGIDYVVLGLGDTNYDKFCHMGKSIDKRLSELGGNRRLALACADEATGLEEPVEAWKASFLSLAKTIYNDYKQLSVPQSEELSKGLLETKKDVEQPSDVLYSEKTTCIDRQPVEEKDPLLQLLETLPTNVLSLKGAAEGLGIQKQFEDAILGNGVTGPAKSSHESSAVKLLGRNCDPSDFKPNLKSMSLQPIPSPPISSPSSISIGQQSPTSEWTVDKPFFADVLTAKWLTSPHSSRLAFNEACEDMKQWGNQKRVVYCEISTKASKIAYLPGDSIGVCCPNPPYAVQTVLNRLQLAHYPELLTLQSAVSIKAASSGTGEAEDEVLSVEEFLRYRIDLTSIPKKASVTSLATACADPVERQQILYLTGKDKTQRSLWNAFVESQGLGMAELLAQFSSCLPTLSQLLAWCPKPVPRYYSIASSPLRKPDSITIAFSLVRNQFTVPVSIAHNDNANNKKVICRAGVCTSYLEYILRYWLYPPGDDSNGRKIPVYHCNDTNITASEHIRLFHKANPNFRLPGSVSYPLILIGPGTGVVPFMSFLEHRHQIELERTRHSEDKIISSGVWRGGFDLDECDLPCESNKVTSFINRVKPNEIWLFYGCRNFDDYLFEDEIDYYREQHSLSHFEIAMSRLATGDSVTDDVSAKKYYVTDKLKEQSQRVYELVINEGGYVYICGDGNAMAKDVQRVLKEIVQQYHPTQPCSEEEANNVLNELRTRRRLLLDIWS